MNNSRSLELQAMSKEEFLKIPEIKTCKEIKEIHVTRNRCHSCDGLIHEGILTRFNDGTVYCQHCGKENRVMGLKNKR